jgi:hypothetical protein
VRGAVGCSAPAPVLEAQKKERLSPKTTPAQLRILRRFMEGFPERRTSPSFSEGEFPMKNNVLKGKETAVPTPGSDAALNGAPAPAAPKAVGTKAPVDAGTPAPTETLDERDARRIEELAVKLKMVRRRRNRRQAKDQKVLLKKSTSEMTTYLEKLPAGARFTIDVLLRVGVKAEELGLSPADLFAKLGVVEPAKQK